MSVQKQNPSAGETQVVEFRLGEDVCAIDIEQVDSIVEVKKVTRIPRTQDSIEGVMDLRGETTAIIDPKEFLSVASDERGNDVLVLDRPDDKQKIGIRVDEVLDVTTHAPEHIDTSDELENLDTRGIRDQIAQGIIKRPDDENGLDLIIWVDIDKMITSLS
ncbi:purine-binding chemotaxis protein cheW1 [Haladaptatus paucihalophilus DX253]|uniref:Purine-binding chemotaxis protein CheW n=1 Tax=Haladaptatus paucihalophilus DX253 TaxID=797209 RepID=E7QQ28_HALPU|nr:MULTISPECIES: chemotaxis protein CheW [Haladaptatus]EFW93092.1 purine-binding chemotaxis protein cheW1 [Haladaptatus paucihalophilus DX253]ODR80409.1 chemotaxis protein [Haladaptatus sp. W1]ODR83098.1 chemotaxis protein [Haladaptatus sp. W1]SHK44459.1 purine-binding chemotaxis protein CheW [Haladaptatus paucihalophilus DX253]GKZ12489.1 chemotaxis protein [Haladaptatus sp. T7]